MTPTVLTGIMVLAGTLAGIFVSALIARKAQKSTDSNASYDQLQEDLKEMREERKRDREAAIREREKDRAEMSYLQSLVLHLDNEVVDLRDDIQSGHIPPLKPRVPRPQRPAVAA